MRKELFNDYKTLILKCIESCINLNQLHCCFDMIDRFDDHFLVLSSDADIRKASQELSAVYLSKKNQLIIF
jgi:hypothetical protein